MTDKYTDFNEEIINRTQEAERVVRQFLPQFPTYRGNLCEAMRYSVEAGGKRLRPIMLFYTCEAFGGNTKDAEPFMAAMEYIHTSSLIHDDLPAIDNDELRRGKATVHKAFGESAGILAGDALLNYAYEVLIQGVISCSNTNGALKAAEIISRKSGLFGMLGGQGLDVASEKGQVSVDVISHLDTVYEMKTAALIEASLMSGAALAGAKEEDLCLLEKIGHNIGMAFQITDDILDATSTTEMLGKPVHSDEKNGKQTYLSFIGQKEAENSAKTHTLNAVALTKELSCDTPFLRDLILYMFSREK